MAEHGTTSDPSGRPGGHTPVLVDATLRLEEAAVLDRWVDRLAPAAAALVRDPKVAGLLHGRALGHAAHPLLVQVPIGTWSSASLLDFVGGKRSRPAARRLIGAGILSAVPSVVTGLAEWAATDDQKARRVGVVHATANTVGLLLYTASYRARGKGRHARGVLLGLAGISVVGASGYLGAHLSLARKVATRDQAFVAQVPLPDEVATAGTSPLAQAAGLATPAGTTGAGAGDAGTSSEGGTGRHVDGPSFPASSL